MATTMVIMIIEIIIAILTIIRRMRDSNQTWNKQVTHYTTTHHY